MSTTRDVTTQSDISKMKTEKDGSFKRLDASFRNSIAPGTKFEAEASTFCDYHRPTVIINDILYQIGITSTSLSLAVRSASFQCRRTTLTFTSV